MEIKSILFATDFSEGSAAALPLVVEMAKKFGAKIHVLHVVYDLESGAGWYVPHINMDEVYSHMEDEARKELRKCCAEELRGIKDTEYTVIRGTPYEEILKYVDSNKIDIIVMGTYGRKGLERLLFGSTASKVVRSAHCPVLTVRAKPQ